MCRLGARSSDAGNGLQVRTPEGVVSAWPHHPLPSVQPRSGVRPSDPQPANSPCMPSICSIPRIAKVLGQAAKQGLSGSVPGQPGLQLRGSRAERPARARQGSSGPHSQPQRLAGPPCRERGPPTAGTPQPPNSGPSGAAAAAHPPQCLHSYSVCRSERELLACSSGLQGLMGGAGAIAASRWPATAAYPPTPPSVSLPARCCISGRQADLIRPFQAALPRTSDAASACMDPQGPSAHHLVGDGCSSPFPTLPAGGCACLALLACRHDLSPAADGHGTCSSTEGTGIMSTLRAHYFCRQHHTQACDAGRCCSACPWLHSSLSPPNAR